MTDEATKTKDPEAPTGEHYEAGKAIAKTDGEAGENGSESSTGIPQDLPGVVPPKSIAQKRAEDLAIAHDECDVVTKRVKEKVKDCERSLLSAMKEADMERVTITDSTGVPRTYYRDFLEKIKRAKV